MQNEATSDAVKLISLDFVPLKLRGSTEEAATRTEDDGSGSGLPLYELTGVN